METERQFNFNLKRNEDNDRSGCLPDMIDVKGLKAKDEKAFRQMVDAYGKSIFNVCLNILANAEDAEDMAQETFIKAFNSMDTFREDAQFMTWLYRIAINKCYDYLKWKKRTKRFAILQPLYNAKDEPLAMAGDFNHPGVVLENKEMAKTLFTALKSLPDKQQTAFVLFEMEGMTYKQIAETMAVSIPAVEAILFRARTALRKKLEAHYKNITSRQ
jgi:RNA polymerase sigma-70 factor (ECF subfamily)